jgi:biotin carboxyl carrier protein
MTVIVDGETFLVAVEPVEEGTVPPAAPDQPSYPGVQTTLAGGESHVTAPMPGTIMDIAVQAGDQVEEGQALCALEAMKMKSPIRSLHAGTVSQVQVHEGQTVEHGDLLFVVD